MSRLGLQALSVVAPPLAERLAMDLFYRPQRRRQEPEVTGLACHRWRLRSRAGWLNAWDYGVGPTVLLVHGWSGAAAQWSRFVGPLVRAGYNAVALDLPAHGFSDGTRTNLAEFVDSVLDAAGRLQPVHAVIAHSLGATATTLALARGLRAQRAVLIAPPARDVPGFVHSFARRVGLAPAREPGLVARMQRRFGDLDQFDALRAAAALTTPALVIHDVGDAQVPFAEGEALARAWPGARLRSLHGLGHNRPLKDADVVRESVAFLAAAGASDAADARTATPALRSIGLAG